MGRLVTFGICLCVIVVAAVTNPPPKPSPPPYPPDTIVLTPTNHLAVVGTIDAASASAFVHAFQRHHASVRYVYIDSYGGSVAAGKRMVVELKARNVTCVVETAYSMAFVLVQACAHRLVRVSGSMMQHQISIANLQGELGKVLSQVRDVERRGRWLDRMQADRLNLTEQAFVARVANEWWLDAESALTHRCADAIAPFVACHATLLAQTVKRTETSSFASVATATIREFSACPLVSEPIRTLAAASTGTTTTTTTTVSNIY